MKKLDITRQVDSFIEKLPAKQFKQVFTKIKDLRKDCRPNDSIKLQGSIDQYRVDCGEYRIIYKYNDNVVYIQIVANRNDDAAYKKNKR